MEYQFPVEQIHNAHTVEPSCLRETDVNGRIYLRVLQAGITILREGDVKNHLTALHLHATVLLLISALWMQNSTALQDTATIQQKIAVKGLLCAQQEGAGMQHLKSVWLLPRATGRAR